MCLCVCVCACMSVGCAGLLRSAFGRRQERTDAQRFSLPRAIPGHLVSAEARAERARLAAGLRKIPLRPPRAGYVHVHVKMDLVYGLVWLLTVLLEGISGQGVYGEWNRDAVVTL